MALAQRLRRRLPDLIALAWIVLVAAMYLSPALHEGGSFGPFGLGSALSGLGHTAAVPYRNGWLGDQIEEFIPWAYFDWQSLHHLQFPLWNPYSALGLPQFFNFQSSVLSLPDLVGYLFPPQLSSLVAVACKVIIAGAGTYVLARVLGLRPWSAAFAATAFELSGAFVNEVGWPLGDVMAWTGWLLAFSYLAYRGRRPRLVVPLLAISVAFAIYGGFPEASVLLFGACAVFLAALALLERRNGGAPARGRAWLALAAGWGAGICLAAPLWLPGLQLLGRSGRAAVGYSALPPSTLITMLAPKYYGSPLRTDGWFGPSGISYNELVVYVGIVALVAAGVGVYAAWRRPEVRALAVTGALMLLAAYQFGPTAWLLAHVPHLNTLAVGRARIPLDFVLALLSGYGVQAIVSEAVQRPAVRRALSISFAAVGGAVVLLLARYIVRGAHGLSAPEALVRFWSFAWPVAMLAPLAATVIWLHRSRPASLGRIGRAALFTLLLASETAFLLIFGTPLNGYSPQFLPETAAEQAVIARVGPGMVGLADPGAPVTHYPSVGVIPELNVAYGLNEFAVYDPMVPRAYFKAWASLTGTKPAAGGWFVPDVNSAAAARVFGIGYVLAPGPADVTLAATAGAQARLTAAGLPAGDLPALEALARRYAAHPDSLPYGTPAFASDLVAGTPMAPLVRASPGLASAIPAMFTVPNWNGMRFAATVGGEVLWRVPGAARFSFTAAGDTVRFAQPTGDGAWTLSVHAPRAGQLTVRLTDVPGWHATIDGRPAKLSPYLDVMQTLPVPAGAHTIRLWYWPPLFTVGIALALAAAALIAGWLLAGRAPRARRGGAAGSSG